MSPQVRPYPAPFLHSTFDPSSDFLVLTHSVFTASVSLHLAAMRGRVTESRCRGGFIFTPRGHSISAALLVQLFDVRGSADQASYGVQLIQQWQTVYITDKPMKGDVVWRRE